MLRRVHWDSEWKILNSHRASAFQRQTSEQVLIWRGCGSLLDGKLDVEAVVLVRDNVSGRSRIHAAYLQPLNLSALPV